MMKQGAVASVLMVMIIAIAILIPSILFAGEIGSQGKGASDSIVNDVAKQGEDFGMGEIFSSSGSTCTKLRPPITYSVDWNQKPSRFFKTDDFEAYDNQQAIVRIAEEEKFPILLALALAYTESYPKFHHLNKDGEVVDSGTGSKGLFQVTHTTAYGYSAGSDYIGKGKPCKADAKGKQTGLCKDLDFCQVEGNIRCAVRVFREKERITANDDSYEKAVRKNCQDPAVVERYLAYKGDSIKKALRAYNHLGCDGCGPAAEDYVELVMEAAKKFQ